MRLFLIRHGEGFHNLPDFKANVPNDYDRELTELGQKQAQAVARWLPNEVNKIDTLYASSLKRAIETAQPIAEKYQVEMVIRDEIREMGSNYADGTAIPSDKHPTNYVKAAARLHPFMPIADDIANGESFADARHRISKFMEMLKAEHAEETVVLVSHGGTMGAILEYIFNAPMPQPAFIWNVNTGITRIHYSKSRINQNYEPWVLIYHGRAEHLNGLMNPYEDLFLG